MIVQRTNNVLVNRFLVSRHVIDMKTYKVFINEYRTLSNRRFLEFRLFEGGILQAVDKYFVPDLFHVKQIVNFIFEYEYGVSQFVIKTLERCENKA